MMELASASFLSTGLHHKDTIVGSHVYKGKDQTRIGHNRPGIEAHTLGEGTIDVCTCLNVKS